MNGNDRGQLPVKSQPLDLRGQRVVIGPIERISANFPVRLAQAAITGNYNTVTKLQKRAGIQQVAVAIDNEPRVVREDGSGTETLCQLAGQRSRADIQREMTAQRQRIQSHVTKRAWNLPAGVVADEEQRPDRLTV